MPPILKIILKKSFRGVCFFLLGCLIFVGCSGCAEKTAPQTPIANETPLQTPAAAPPSRQHESPTEPARRESAVAPVPSAEGSPSARDASGSARRGRLPAEDAAANQMPDRSVPALPEDPVSAARLLREKRAADIEFPGVPPAYYYGDILLWIPGWDYETVGNTHLDSIPKFPPKESHKKGKSIPRKEYLQIPEAERMMMAAEAITHGMSRLNATKFFMARGGAMYHQARLAFAQQALDENPNDFHTLHVWTSVQQSSDIFFGDDGPLKLPGYRRLLEMKPDSARVLVEYALYLPRSETAEKIRRSMRGRPFIG